ncbi:MAG: TonB-dependent receptor, partial [Prevotellaceae bacterium]|nr:TonB-dependent receptor [Prevotellaceae bacterium]
VAVGNRSNITVKLESKSNVLEEVVAIGYGVQKKKLITGATVQVKGEDISKMNTVSALGALQSQTPGVNITKMSGKPGEGFRVTIRGLGTVGNSSPLYIIDGIPSGTASDAISNLNPADIESVDVLKDAASAAIYGARAANGVVLVTTKQGKKGKASIQYDGYYGIQNIYKKLTPLNADQYMEIINESSGVQNNYIRSMSDFDKAAYENGSWTGTNWLDEMIMENAPITNHTLNITGGTDMSRYSFGFGYTAQSPVIGVENGEIDPLFERYNFRINSDHDLIKLKDFTLLQFGQTLTMVHKNNDGLGMAIGTRDWNDVGNALKASPLYQVYDENGDFNKAGWNASEDNPIAKMYYNSFVNSKNYSVRASFFAVLQPVKNLKYRTAFSINYSGWTSRQFRPVYALSQDQNPNSKISQGSGNGYGWNFDNTLEYKYKWEEHNFEAMAGISAEKWGMGEDLSATTYDSQFDDFKHAYLSNGIYTENTKISIGGSPWGEGGIMSYFGRVNYDYMGTYMATAVLRRDGSSTFARGYRWGTFPSFSAGWIVSNESFMENSRSWMDFLKIRASWGQNGNHDIGSFRYIANINLSSWSGRYTFGTDKSNPTLGAYQENIANSALKWETSEQLNLGVDAWFLASRLGLNADYYVKTTKDWLVNPPALGTWGTSAPYVNGGDVRNNGVEFLLTWKDKIRSFNYSVTGNISYNKNKVTRIANQEGIINGGSGILSHGTDVIYRAQEGYPIGYFLGYKADGIIQTVAEAAEYDSNYKIPSSDGGYLQSQPGDIKFVDTYEDGVIDAKDRTMIGNPHPDYTYGLTINLGWKGIDFSVVGSGVIGNQIIKSYRSYMNSINQNYTTEILDRWTGEGSSNTIPRITPGSLQRNWSLVSDQLFLEDGDYFRISNVTLGYDFNQLAGKSSPFSQLRLYVAAQNPITFTKYSGMDPEIGYGGAAWAKGVDLGTFPSSRTFLLGVSIKY